MSAVCSNHDHFSVQPKTYACNVYHLFVSLLGEKVSVRGKQFSQAGFHCLMRNPCVHHDTGTCCVSKVMCVVRKGACFLYIFT